MVAAGLETTCCNNDVSDAEVNVPDENTESAGEILHMLERCTLEYFIAMIWMKSKKQPVHWLMLSPLGHYSKDCMQPGRKNPSCGSQCTIKMAWKKLDDIFEECLPVLMNRIKCQNIVRLAITWRLISKG